MDREAQISEGHALLKSMREAFSISQFDGVVAAHEQLGTLAKVPRHVRLEATCLAARAFIAQKDRSRARALLKEAAAEQYSKPIHYDFLAHAFLDLRNYEEAARMCHQAHDLRAARDD